VNRPFILAITPFFGAFGFTCTTSGASSTFFSFFGAFGFTCTTSGTSSTFFSFFFC